MRRRSKKQTLTIIYVLAALLIVLIAAGTILRMHSDNMGFMEALSAFLNDTFHPYGN